MAKIISIKRGKKLTKKEFVLYMKAKGVLMEEGSTILVPKSERIREIVWKLEAFDMFKEFENYAKHEPQDKTLIASIVYHKNRLENLFRVMAERIEADEENMWEKMMCEQGPEDEVTF